MSTGSLSWYVARAGGLVSWFLLAASVIWGLLLSSKVLGRLGSRRWLLDLHRFLGGLAVIFVGVHLVGLVADTYVDFGLREVLVPFTSSWRPAAVAWGIVGLYLLLAVEITSLVRKRLPRRVWHAIHLGSFGLFVFATVHLLLAGSDASHPLVRLTVATTVGVVVFLTAYRVLLPLLGRLDGPLPEAPRASAPRPSPAPASPPPPATALTPASSWGSRPATPTAPHPPMPSAGRTWDREPPAAPPLREPVPTSWRS